MLALLSVLAGCKDKPVYSIEKTTPISYYANNPIFTAKPIIETGYDLEYNWIRYTFNDMPVSVYNIPLDDLKFDHGMIYLEYLKTADPEKLTPNFSLYFNGGDNFRLLADRIIASGLVDHCEGYFQLLPGGVEWLKWSKVVDGDSVVCIQLRYIHSDDMVIVSSSNGID